MEKEAVKEDIIEQKTMKKVVFILGPTGIGKTFVSINLGIRTKGTIVNTDAFSLYCHGSIMTAKATKAEQATVPHIMIDMLDCDNTSYTVNQFKVDAFAQINQLSNLPIIVGGTNYYVDSLLFQKTKVIQVKSIEPLPSQVFSNKCTGIESSIKELIKDNKNSDALYSEISNHLTNKCSIEELNALLCEVDPVYANFFHKNDTRRIINVIAYYFTYGHRKSEDIMGDSKQLRFANATKMIVLAIKDFDLLDKRIRMRIDDMLIKQGGLAEIFHIFTLFKGKEITFTTGLLQAIGYKEFHPLYVLASKVEGFIENIIKGYDEANEALLSDLSSKLYETIKSDKEMNETYEKCKDDLIKNTIKYAKYQIKWIKKKILPFIKGYHLVNIEDFTKETYNKYVDAMESYVNSNDSYCGINSHQMLLDDDKNNSIISESQTINNEKLSQWKKYHCDICNCEMNGESENIAHFKSNSHKKRKAKQKKYHSSSISSSI